MGGNGKTLRIVVGVAIVGLAFAVYAFRPGAGGGAADEAPEAAAAAELPRLLDLGADRCIPCKKMAPILAELTVTYEDVFAVEFVDVWKDPEAAKPHGLRVIPTQIFFAADGAELFRHEGFISREDILAKWRELGIRVPDRAPAPEPGA
jgi:thioredoxin 1